MYPAYAWWWWPARGCWCCWAQPKGVAGAAGHLQGCHSELDPHRAWAGSDVCAQGAPLVCAHGGDAAIGHPANTREAVLAAAAAGARCVELDLSITADGQLVPLHARELQLLSGRPAAQVDDLLLADVQALEWCALLNTSSALSPAQTLTLNSTPHIWRVCGHGVAGVCEVPKDQLLSCLSACGHSEVFA